MKWKGVIFVHIPPRIVHAAGLYVDLIAHAMQCFHFDAHGSTFLVSLCCRSVLKGGKQYCFPPFSCSVSVLYCILSLNASGQPVCSILD